MLDLIELKPLVQTLVYSMLGLVLLGVGFGLIMLISPFSIRKEIEEDQNTSLGIIIGSVFLSLAIIIAAAVHG